ncbi:peptidase M1 [Niabella ginsenosidivorans]|uniref:Peptidase M1 n=1 Tax=Niabella ginsenosidivorans TaxID=1176587 RepID=A0A1A9I5J9_9BACT|nr:M1 family metallopeptidase [Niabella ginsenosidivorans]ANH82896.1 peptidase M1 [Niabella ginsenosidivorans]
MYKAFTCAVCLFYSVAGTAQNYDPNKTFAPGFYSHNGNEFRSADGAPGSKYWQNQANYAIEATFDTTTNVLSGNEIIEYSNNSPDNLEYLWLELDQNADKEDARAQSLAKPGQEAAPDKGFRLSRVVVENSGQVQEADYVVQDTRMQIRLGNPLTAGKSLRLKIGFSFKLLSSSAGDRAGILQTKNGKIYEFGYWFPRMCVYDDLNGWNTLPFIGGGEFYFEYGTIDYKITVPAGMLAVGSGQLLNGQEVLSDRVLANLSKARRSDKTVMIHPAEAVTRSSVTKKTSGTVTWHFAMNNTRDAAFALSRAFIWDGAKINLPSGKTAFAQSVYPEESIRDKSEWHRATEYVKASVEDFSKRWFEYPYPEATNVAGPIGGMEFPALAFDYYKEGGKGLWALVSHEIGHTWYPMIVGSDERRYPFMDEGFNTFIDIYAQEYFNNGEFAPKRDGEYAPKGGNPADEIIPVIKATKGGPTLLTAPDAMDYKYVHPLAYFKTAFGLVLLREVILGQDRFDYAFRTYTKNWAFKHPSPVDFFRSMENAAGEDLSWFWREWFYNNWELDQAVAGVKYVEGDPQKGALITIENKEQMVLPLPMEITETNGHTQTIQVPVEIWQQGAQRTIRVRTTSPVTSVIIDPRHQLPDSHRENNVWKK